MNEILQHTNLLCDNVQQIYPQAYTSKNANVLKIVNCRDGKAENGRAPIDVTVHTNDNKIQQTQNFTNPLQLLEMKRCNRT